jgi:hypothetical protein
MSAKISLYGYKRKAVINCVKYRLMSLKKANKMIYLLTVFYVFIFTVALYFSEVGRISYESLCFLGMCFLGIGMYTAAFLRYSKIRTIRDVSTSKIKSVSIGFAELNGIAKSIKKTDKPIIRAAVGSRRTAEDFIIFNPFILESNGGKILIDSEKARLFITERKINGIAQRTIRDGDEVYCLGTVEEYKNNNNRVEKLFEDAEVKNREKMYIVTKGKDKSEFFISNRTECDILKIYGRVFNIYMIFGAIAIVAGLFFFITLSDLASLEIFSIDSIKKTTGMLFFIGLLTVFIERESQIF